MKDEALRLALEALEDLGYHHHDCPQWPTFVEPENYPKCNCGYDQAITAIKSALEAKDEPVQWGVDWGKDGNSVSIIKRLAGGNIEVLAWEYAPHSPQRTWIGLTDEDKHLFSSWLDHKTDDEVFAAIEAKLKEKNT